MHGAGRGVFGGRLTSNGFCDNGGMVMGMIARVEIVVMKKSMKPIIQKFHRTRMNQSC
jgi:hypothetical protein